MKTHITFTVSETFILFRQYMKNAIYFCHLITSLNILSCLLTYYCLYTLESLLSIDKRTQQIQPVTINQQTILDENPHNIHRFWNIHPFWTLCWKYILPFGCVSKYFAASYLLFMWFFVIQFSNRICIPKHPGDIQRVGKWEMEGNLTYTHRRTLYKSFS